MATASKMNRNNKPVQQKADWSAHIEYHDGAYHVWSRSRQKRITQSPNKQAAIAKATMRGYMVSE